MTWAGPLHSIPWRLTLVALSVAAGCAVRNPAYRPRAHPADGGAPQGGSDGTETGGGLEEPDGPSPFPPEPPALDAVARDTALPALDAARDTAPPALDGTRDTALPALDATPDTAVSPPRDAAAVAIDAHPPTTVAFSFEGSTEEWIDLRWDWFKPNAKEMTLRTSTLEHLLGTQSVEIPLVHDGSMNWPTVGIRKKYLNQLPPGTVITYHVWFPSNGSITGVQPYVLYYRPTDPDSDPQWSGVTIYEVPALKPGWNVITHQVPVGMDPVRGVSEVGMEWRTNGAQTVKVYMDDIYWNAP